MCYFIFPIMSADIFQFKLGRIFLGRIPSGEDIIRAVEHLCRKNAIQLATFSVSGMVSLFTIGVFDQKQHVHVTSRKEIPMEIINCTGDITLHSKKAQVQAKIILADQLGKTTGGCLFSETLLFAGEVNIVELLGSPVIRKYDQNSGRMLWTAKT